MSDINVNDLLDMDLDDLADMPEYVTPPAGSYVLRLIKLGPKAIGDHPAWDLKAAIVATAELADASETPVADGSEFNCAYMMDNEFGQGAFKAAMAGLKDHFGVSKLADLREHVVGLEVFAQIKNRVDKKDKTKRYAEITTMIVQ